MKTDINCLYCITLHSQISFGVQRSSSLQAINWGLERGNPTVASTLFQTWLVPDTGQSITVLLIGLPFMELDSVT